MLGATNTAPVVWGVTALALLQLGHVMLLDDGTPLVTRFIERGDAAALQEYVRSLSQLSRSSRFLGAASELPRSELEQSLRVGDGGRFSLIAEITVGGVPHIVAEARYALNGQDNSVEIALSIHDQWQRHGIGMAIMSDLECRAAALNADSVFGDMLGTNAGMRALAAKRGYAFERTPGDWRLLRFRKSVTALHGQPCVCLAEARVPGAVVRS